MKKDKTEAKVIKALEECDPDERFTFAIDLLFYVALYGGCNVAESIGMLELTKKMLIEAHDDYVCDECKEKEAGGKDD